MGCTFVYAQACRKSNTSFKSILFYESPNAILDVISNFRHCHAWPDKLASILPDQTVDFCSFANVFICRFRVFVHDTVQVPFFFRSCAPVIATDDQKSLGTRNRCYYVLILVFHNLAFWIFSVWKELGQAYSGWISLDRFFLLWFLLLLFLCCSFWIPQQMSTSR